MLLNFLQSTTRTTQPETSARPGLRDTRQSSGLGNCQSFSGCFRALGRSTCRPEGGFHNYKAPSGGLSFHGDDSNHGCALNRARTPGTDTEGKPFLSCWRGASPNSV